MRHHLCLAWPILAAAIGWLPPRCFATQIISESSPYVGITLYDVLDNVTDVTNGSGSITSGTFGAGRQFHYTITQINLAAAGISFVDTASNGSTGTQTVNTQTTTQFLNSSGAAVAINANYFNFTGLSPTNLVSLETHAGSHVAPWPTNPGAVPGINISASNVVNFIKPASTAAGDYNAKDMFSGATVTLYNAIGSNFMSVKNGATTGAIDDGNDNARSSIGMKGNSLYLFTVDDYSSNDAGLAPAEVGLLLKNTWGLTNVMNLDGGGSSQMAIRTTRGVGYFNSPKGLPGGTRPVGSNLAVKATNAASQVNTIDDFETTDAATGLTKSATGYFYGTTANSGSNANIAATSTATRVTTQKHGGSGSMQLTINDSSTTAGFTERFLSGAAHSYSNERFASSGYFGFWIKTNTPLLTVSPVIDDDTIGTDLVNGTSTNLIADGKWHLYQWNMNDATRWDSYNQDSDGAITSAVVNLNSILFKSSTAENATIYFDDVDFTQTGAIPEPGSLLLFIASLGASAMRPRNRWMRCPSRER